MKHKKSFGQISFSIPTLKLSKESRERWYILGISISLVVISIIVFWFYYINGLGIAYNDARSHLNIGRRVVEGLKPGLAQLGSVWLPLPHALMIPTIWNDFMWHSGLSGALVSMISFVVTGLTIDAFLKRLRIGYIGRLVAVLSFVLNFNILYLTATAMTELLLLATMTVSAYFLLVWVQQNRIIDLLKAAFFVMLSTLVRYDGWFLLFTSTLVLAYIMLRRKGLKNVEGAVIFYCTLAGFGVFLWLLWNLIIFKDPFFFAFGPFSAHSQQLQLESAGNLPTKSEWLLSAKIYLYALAYNSYTFPAILSLFGVFALLRSKLINHEEKVATLVLLAPLAFNILALYLGHSVLFIQGISGDTWFNVRYGVMLMPTIAVFIGILINAIPRLRALLIGLLAFVLFFAYVNYDAVTIDDAQVGSSQKNVSEVSGWLSKNTYDKEGFILISAASHDAIIFSSGLPMSRFIHEGTGLYWESATTSPDRWARWIVMRTNDVSDLTFRQIRGSDGFVGKYELIDSYPFADIYQLKEEYLEELNTKPVFLDQK